MIVQGYSTDVRLSLIVGEQVLPLSQIRPGFAIFARLRRVSSV